MDHQSITHPLYVAIDVGKNIHCYGAFAGWALQPVRPAREVRNNRIGYAHFRTWLTQQIEQREYHPVILGMEPTGIYHEPWAYAIRGDFGAQIDLRFLNPYQTKQKRKQLMNGRKRKSDPIDVQATAHCLRDGLGHPAWLGHGEALRFELWAADLRQLTARTTASTSQSLDSNRPTMARGLGQCPSVSKSPSPLGNACAFSAESTPAAPVGTSHFGTPTQSL